MTIGHRIVDADDTSRVYCDGHVVMVWMNPATGMALPLPATIRAAAGHD
jgi:acyl-CoA thioester hydrolase